MPARSGGGEYALGRRERGRIVPDYHAAELTRLAARDALGRGTRRGCAFRAQCRLATPPNTDRLLRTSGDGYAAVGDDRLTGDEAAGPGCEEYRDAADFLGFAQAPQRRHLLARRARLFIFP